MTEEREDLIADRKYVELTYQVIDQKTDDVLTEVAHPLAYVHGTSEVLAPRVTQALEGKAAGDVVEVPIDCTELYGPRDESLVLVESVHNVPKEYRKVGSAILMENDRGQTKSFLVTHLDDKTITIDGNNPLCGKQVIFKVTLLVVRDATAAEIEVGGRIGEDASADADHDGK